MYISMQKVHINEKTFRAYFQYLFGFPRIVNQYKPSKAEQRVVENM